MTRASRSFPRPSPNGHCGSAKNSSRPCRAQRVHRHGPLRGPGFPADHHGEWACVEYRRVAAHTDVLDLDQADTVRQLAGEAGTERDVEVDDSRRAASAGTPAMGGEWPGRPRWRLRTDQLVLGGTSPRRGATAVCGWCPTVTPRSVQSPVVTAVRRARAWRPADPAACTACPWRGVGVRARPGIVPA